MDFWNKIKNGVSNAWNWVKDQWNDLSGVTANQQSVQETNQANKDIASDTNAMNYDVAMQNLGFQKDLQEYNKALQQKIFEREDTSYQRTAQDMLNAGLNPLSMQGTNGSGEAIAMSPMENNFQAQQSAPMQTYQRPNQINEFINAIGSVISGITDLKNGQINRDRLTLERQKADIDSFNATHDKGYYIDKSGKMVILDQDLYDKYTSNILEKIEEEQRERKHKIVTGKYDTDTEFEKTITAVTDWLTSGRGEAQWNQLKKTFPFLQLFDDYAKSIMEDPYTEIKYSNGESDGYWTERSTGRKYTKDKNGNKVYQ